MSKIKVRKLKNQEQKLTQEKYLEAIQETSYLENHGVGEVVSKREQDDTGFSNADDINWDNL